MSDRNPFEIRTRMLELAQNYLGEQYATNLEFAKQAFDELVKTNQAAAQDWQRYAPKMYDFTDIVRKAQELYGFVSKRD